MLDEEDELDKRARELGLDKIDSDEPQVIESKSSAPARVRGKQDSESQIEKLGSDSVVMLLSLGEFRFHCLVVKCKP